MGRPVVHWELWSENPDKAAEFYQQVFDWNIQHIPDLKYHVVDTGGGGINGGIMKPQRGPWPGKLAFYIDVDDIEAYSGKPAEKSWSRRWPCRALVNSRCSRTRTDGPSESGSNRNSAPLISTTREAEL